MPLPRMPSPTWPIPTLPSGPASRSPPPGSPLERGLCDRRMASLSYGRPYLALLPCLGPFRFFHWAVSDLKAEVWLFLCHLRLPAWGLACSKHESAFCHHGTGGCVLCCFSGTSGLVLSCYHLIRRWGGHEMWSQWCSTAAVLGAKFFIGLRPPGVTCVGRGSGIVSEPDLGPCLGVHLSRRPGSSAARSSCCQAPGSSRLSPSSVSKLSSPGITFADGAEAGHTEPEPLLQSSVSANPP